MSLRITKVEIRNFRSVRNLLLEPGKLAVLVGKNDSGKSNVLRALNLFFNDRTMPAADLDFELNHNIYNKPNRRAKEISIKLEIEIPATYRNTNGDFIVWKRRWRSGGSIPDEILGQRIEDGPRGGTSFKPVKIPPQSNVRALLQNINYFYVPAIKDLKYFSMLRAKIYDTIAEVADQQFRDSSHDFEQSISAQLQDLTTQIAASLGIKSRLALPKDLSHIFESLDFLSEGQNISLESRGDGIKARHIPLILKFMAEKKRLLQVQGSAPHTFIWGYEEPENNLELSGCVELADQFWEFVGQEISQVFLTTHSPVFYNLHRKVEDGGSRITCHHIFREADNDGTKGTNKLGDLDDRMGTTALFAPMVAELENKIRRQEQARAEVEQLAQANRRKLFVEGPSDKLILDKALTVFASERVKKIDVVTQDDGGTNYVIAMLHSWRSRAKFQRELPKAAGLLDLDAEGKKASKEWNGVPGNVDSAKCFKLPVPPHIIPIKKAGIRMPVVLECMYDRQAWELAKRQGYLESRGLRSIISDEWFQQIAYRKTTVVTNFLHHDWAIFVEQKFKQKGKRPMAEFYANMKPNEFKSRMFFMEDLINEIIDYLFSEEE